MSNDASKNPIRIDTVGTVTNHTRRITGYTVVPSQLGWEAVLFSTGSNFGTKLFHAKGGSNQTYESMYPRPKPTMGIEAVTLTNITEIMVHTDEAD